jgi:phospholipase A1
MRFLRSTPAFFLILCGAPLAASAAPASLAACMGIPDNTRRLACFDEFAAAANGGEATPATVAAAQPVSSLAGAPAAAFATAPVGRMARHWELEPDPNHDILDFRNHRANYLMATYSHAPNGEPYRPFRTLLNQDLSHAELAFQIGFKMKLLDDAFRKPLDLWFGYTQNSYWQAANHKASSPFRETNYQPEVMAIAPLPLKRMGLDAAFVGVGVVHQSNGQASTISRSWNRVYGQLGMERGDFSLVGRVWKRMSEDLADDNNPDITDFMGRGDITATYHWDGHEVSALARHNFHTNKGGLQLDYSYPLAGKVSGYVQLFTGYGQSLIDYNYAQRSIGLGLKVAP